MIYLEHRIGQFQKKCPLNLNFLGGAVTNLFKKLLYWIICNCFRNHTATTKDYILKSTLFLGLTGLYFLLGLILTPTINTYFLASNSNGVIDFLVDGLSNIIGKILIRI